MLTSLLAKRASSFSLTARRHLLSLGSVPSSRGSSSVATELQYGFGYRASLVSERTHLGATSNHNNNSPGTFDAFQDDQAFGAYDYVPSQDDYDEWDKIEQQQFKQSDNREFTPFNNNSKDNDMEMEQNIHGAGWEIQGGKQMQSSFVPINNNNGKENKKKATFVPLQQDVDAVNSQTTQSPKPAETTQAPTAEPTASKEAVEKVQVAQDEALPNPLASSPSSSSSSQPEDTQRQQQQQRASRGMSVSTDADRMQGQLEVVLQKIVQETNNPKFNPNSPRQVSEALFGVPGESTNKDVLEALAWSGQKKELANWILQYRQINREITKFKKRQAKKESGTIAKSVYTIVKPTKQQQQQPVKDAVPTNAPATGAALRTAADPLLLVDASAYIFRAYFAFPPLHRADGMPIGALLGFCNMLNKLVLNVMMEGKQPRIVLVFDAPGKTFRHGIYELYKANRPEAPVDLIPQFALIRQAAKAYGIVQIEAPTYEADDVIATLSRMAVEEGIDCNILSGDKDLMQLVTTADDAAAPSVQMIDPMTMNRVTHDDVIEKWGVPADKLGDVLALAGDSADNVPGVPGIGPKTAAELIGSYGSLENLLKNAEDVKQKGRREKLQANADQARLSRVLVELERNVPMEQMTFPEGIDTVSDLRMELMNPEELSEFFGEMGLKELRYRFERRLQEQKGIKLAPQTKTRPSRSRKWAPRPKTEIPKPEDYKDVPF
ncbi:DNA polymerase I [Seminavis robusta]|uniref:DNA polymerase I n=1 Tax=Seminavis robusta TaxID=568900 RepID=A0A9N8H9E8_9STRA|nr:DNA polymerase I [Seminavis robusta]|eukprot:Sro273_g105060.1 DNA polymerase I (721) ;mRNA; r:16925-19178